ncbi:MAG: zinc ribbon domain-containing protein [Deltaproteobacteria bacterium]|nr:zinc ribbon domain-containing protein [Deltaproteobacteria bacterium]
MPIYEFQCLKCGREFEELVLSTREVVVCPVCGQSDCQKHMSSFSFGPKNGGDLSSLSSSSSSCGSCASTSCVGCGSSH